MTEAWFTSDQHLGHRNILKYEPGRLALGDDVDAMNEAMIERWNSVVSPGDQVMVIGDWAMGQLSDTLPLTPRFNGIKTLILGNHDRPFTRPNFHARYMDAGFAGVINGPVVYTPKGDGLPQVILNHFPFAPAGAYDTRFADYHPDDDGDRLLLHGHVHSTWKFRTRQINVGCDLWDFYPQTLAALVDGYMDWLRTEPTPRLQGGLDRGERGAG